MKEKVGTSAGVKVRIPFCQESPLKASPRVGGEDVTPVPARRTVCRPGVLTAQGPSSTLTTGHRASERLTHG